MFVCMFGVCVCSYVCFILFCCLVLVFETGLFFYIALDVMELILDHAGLKLTEILASTYRVLGLKV